MLFREIHANNFGDKHGLLNLRQNKQIYLEHEKEAPHGSHPLFQQDHFYNEDFRSVPYLSRLNLCFPVSHSRGAAVIWLGKKNPRFIDLPVNQPVAHQGLTSSDKRCVKTDFEKICHSNDAGVVKHATPLKVKNLQSQMANLTGHAFKICMSAIQLLLPVLELFLIFVSLSNPEPPCCSVVAPVPKASQFYFLQKKLMERRKGKKRTTKSRNSMKSLEI
ncbi:hypothetical protein Tco_1418920 [Tanacetum coccineum]